MKTKLILLFLCLFSFLSCEKDDYFNSIEKNAATDENSSNDYQKSVITINNQVFPVGFGLNPNGLNDYKHSYVQPAYASPLKIEDRHKILDNSPFGRTSKTQVIVIRDKYDLERLTSKIRSRKISLFGITVFRDRNRLDELFKFDNKTVYFLAKAELVTHRVTLSGKPQLTDRASEMLKNGEYSNFNKKYGPGYVSSQTFGGNLYYVFAYRNTNSSNASNSNFIRPLKNKIENFFGIESNEVLAEYERELVKNVQLEFQVATNIKNFIPKPIKNSNEFYQEIKRANGFLDKNRNLAASTDIVIKPYNTIIRGFDAAFSGILDKEVQKFDNWKAWNEVRFTTENIIGNSPYVSFRQAARKIRETAYKQLFLIETNYDRSQTVNEVLEKSSHNYVNIYQYNNSDFSYILTPEKHDPQLDIYGPTRTDYSHNLNYTIDSYYPKFIVKIISTSRTNDIAVYKKPWGCGSLGRGGPRYYTKKISEIENTDNGSLNMDYGESFLGFSSKYYKSDPNNFVKVLIPNFNSTNPCKYRYRVKYRKVTDPLTYNVWFIARKKF